MISSFLVVPVALMMSALGIAQRICVNDVAYFQPDKVFAIERQSTNIIVGTCQEVKNMYDMGQDCMAPVNFTVPGVNGSGKISWGELQAAMNMLGCCGEEPQMQLLSCYTQNCSQTSDVPMYMSEFGCFPCYATFNYSQQSCNHCFALDSSGCSKEQCRGFGVWDNYSNSCLSCNAFDYHGCDEGSCSMLPGTTWSCDDYGNCNCGSCTLDDSGMCSQEQCVDLGLSWRCEYGDMYCHCGQCCLWDGDCDDMDQGYWTYCNEEQCKPSPGHEDIVFLTRPYNSTMDMTRCSRCANVQIGHDTEGCVNQNLCTSQGFVWNCDHNEDSSGYCCQQCDGDNAYGCQHEMDCRRAGNAWCRDDYGSEWCTQYESDCPVLETCAFVSHSDIGALMEHGFGPRPCMGLEHTPPPPM